VTRDNGKQGARARWRVVASLIAIDLMEGRKKKVERHFVNLILSFHKKDICNFFV
jgi:hypothetical protein